MDQYGFLEANELITNSWQAAAHEKGMRFYGPPANPNRTYAMQDEFAASLLGKTVLQSFQNGERRQVTNFSTDLEQTLILTAVQPDECLRAA